MSEPSSELSLPPVPLAFVGWASLGAAAVGLVYALLITQELRIAHVFPDVLALHGYMAGAGALVGGALGAALWALLRVRKIEVDDVIPYGLAVGACGYPLALHGAAAAAVVVTGGSSPVVAMVLFFAAALAMPLVRLGLARLEDEGRLRRGLTVFGVGWLLGSLGVQGLAFAAPSAESAASERGPCVKVEPRPAKKVLWYSIDGATWSVLRPLIDEGRLPTFAKLVGEGASGILRSAPPGNSSALMTSLATGRTPTEHGIQALMELRMPGIDAIPCIADPTDYGGAIDGFYMVAAAAYQLGYAEAIPRTSFARRTQALWNILDRAGRRSTFVAWPSSWPAEPLEQGRIVSNLHGYSEMEMFFSHRDDLPSTAHPPELMSELAPLVRPPTHTDEALLSLAEWTEAERASMRATELKLIGVDHFTLLKYGYNWDQSNLDILQRLLAARQDDLMAIHLSSVDLSEHLFWHHRFPEEVPGVPASEVKRLGHMIGAFYELLDQRLAALLKAVEPGTRVLITSDHGMTTQRHLFGWGTHALDGVWVLWGEGIKPTQDLQLSIYDVTPLLLHLQGFPTAETMRGRVPTEVLVEPGEVRTIPTYEAPKE